MLHHFIAHALSCDVPSLPLLSAVPVAFTSQSLFVWTRGSQVGSSEDTFPPGSTPLLCVLRGSLASELGGGSGDDATPLQFFLLQPHSHCVSALRGEPTALGTHTPTVGGLEAVEEHMRCVYSPVMSGIVSPITVVQGGENKGVAVGAQLLEAYKRWGEFTSSLTSAVAAASGTTLPPVQFTPEPEVLGAIAKCKDAGRAMSSSELGLAFSSGSEGLERLKRCVAGWRAGMAALIKAVEDRDRVSPPIEDSEGGHLPTTLASELKWWSGVGEACRALSSTLDNYATLSSSTSPKSLFSSSIEGSSPSLSPALSIYITLSALKESGDRFSPAGFTGDIPKVQRVCCYVSEVERLVAGFPRPSSSSTLADMPVGLMGAAEHVKTVLGTAIAGNSPNGMALTERASLLWAAAGREAEASLRSLSRAALAPSFNAWQSKDVQSVGSVALAWEACAKTWTAGSAVVSSAFSALSTNSRGGGHKLSIPPLPLLFSDTVCRLNALASVHLDYTGIYNRLESTSSIAASIASSGGLDGGPASRGFSHPSLQFTPSPSFQRLVLDLEGTLSDFHGDWTALSNKCGDPLEDGGSATTTSNFLRGLEGQNITLKRLFSRLSSSFAAAAASVPPTVQGEYERASVLALSLPWRGGETEVDTALEPIIASVLRAEESVLQGILSSCLEPGNGGDGLSARIAQLKGQRGLLGGVLGRLPLVLGVDRKEAMVDPLHSWRVSHSSMHVAPLVDRCLEASDWARVAGEWLNDAEKRAGADGGMGALQKPVLSASRVRVRQGAICQSLEDNSPVPSFDPLEFDTDASNRGSFASFLPAPLLVPHGILARSSSVGAGSSSATLVSASSIALSLAPDTMLVARSIESLLEQRVGATSKSEDVYVGWVWKDVCASVESALATHSHPTPSTALGLASILTLKAWPHAASLSKALVIASRGYSALHHLAWSLTPLLSQSSNHGLELSRLVLDGLVAPQRVALEEALGRCCSPQVTWVGESLEGECSAAIKAARGFLTSCFSLHGSVGELTASFSHLQACAFSREALENALRSIGAALKAFISAAPFGESSPSIAAIFTHSILKVIRKRLVVSIRALSGGGSPASFTCSVTLLPPSSDTSVQPFFGITCDPPLPVLRTQLMSLGAAYIDTAASIPLSFLLFGGEDYSPLGYSALFHSAPSPLECGGGIEWWMNEDIQSINELSSASDGLQTSIERGIERIEQRLSHLNTAFGYLWSVGGGAEATAAAFLQWSGRDGDPTSISFDLGPRACTGWSEVLAQASEHFHAMFGKETGPSFSFSSIGPLLSLDEGQLAPSLIAHWRAWFSQGKKWAVEHIERLAWRIEVGAGKELERLEKAACALLPQGGIEDRPELLEGGSEELKAVLQGVVTLHGCTLSCNSSDKVESLGSVSWNLDLESAEMLESVLENLAAANATYTSSSSSAHTGARLSSSSSAVMSKSVRLSLKGGGVLKTTSSARFALESLRLLTSQCSEAVKEDGKRGLFVKKSLGAAFSWLDEAIPSTQAEWEISKSLGDQVSLGPWETRFSSENTLTLAAKVHGEATHLEGWIELAANARTSLFSILSLPLSTPLSQQKILFLPPPPLLTLYSSLSALKASTRDVLGLWECLDNYYTHPVQNLRCVRPWNALLSPAEGVSQEFKPKSFQATLASHFKAISQVIEASVPINWHSRPVFTAALGTLAQWGGGGVLSLFGECSHPACSLSNWDAELGSLLGLPSLSLASSSLGELLDALEGVVSGASGKVSEKTLRGALRSAVGEAGVHTYLNELASEWGKVFWECSSPRPLSRVCVVSGWEDLLSKLGEGVQGVASARSSPFFSERAFGRLAGAWEDRLSACRAFCDTWMEVQRLWLHLEGLFGAAGGGGVGVRGGTGDLAVALPNETAKFSRVEDEFAWLGEILCRVRNPLAAPVLSLPSFTPSSSTGAATTAAPATSILLPFLPSYTVDTFGGVSILGVAEVESLLLLPPTTSFLQSPSLIITRLTALSEILSGVQLAVFDFISSRRGLFPRLYFLGDEDVLQCMGAAGDPSSPVLSRHLPKLFGGISGLVASVRNDDSLPATVISGVVSCEGETLSFPHASAITVPSNATLPLHAWLSAVDEATSCALTQKSLEVAEKITFGGDFPALCAGNGPSTAASLLPSLLYSYPCQVTLLGSWIAWTGMVEWGLRSLSSSQVPSSGNTGSRAALSFVTTAVSILSGELCAGGVGGSKQPTTFARTPLTPLTRKVFEQSVLDLVHKRDVSAALLTVTSVEDFDWKCRLRAYSSTGDKSHQSLALPSLSITIEAGCADLTHGGEYAGVGSRLVTTPLTERAYLALTHALALKRGGSPMGPAGTGKTETVKALGLACGRYVAVFNCDENFECGAMARILEGLCRTGAWGCFDEFNRLTEGTLSAISSCIMAIQSALVAASPGVQLSYGGGSTNNPSSPSHSLTPLSPHVALFVTMNPGYAGRSSLPDNLKSLFRPIAMVVPDTALIASVTLSTAGFSPTTSAPLAAALTKLFSASASSLSHASHYDWGLRALKTVLALAGEKRGKMGSVSTPKLTGDLENTDELRALASATLEAVLPRLCPEDLAPFLGLFKEAFPRLYSDAGRDEAGGSLVETLLAISIASVAESQGLVWYDSEKVGSAVGEEKVAHLASLVGGGIVVGKRTPLGVVPSTPLVFAPPSTPSLSLASTLGEAALASFSRLIFPISSERQSSKEGISSTSGNAWFEKVRQLATTLDMRHGVMLLGPPGTGKSSAWRTLLAALELIDGIKGVVHVCDPKCLIKLGMGKGGGKGGTKTSARSSLEEEGNMEQLYGRLDSGTLEWRDGWLTSLLRTLNEGARGEGKLRQWIIFDGEVDPAWAENLNSVLDDNKVLTLPSGERLSLPPNTRIIFEVDETRYATLATVSRVGLVHFHAQVLPPDYHFSAYLHRMQTGKGVLWGPRACFVPARPHPTALRDFLEAEDEGKQDSLKATFSKVVGNALKSILCSGGLAQEALRWATLGVVNGDTSRTFHPIMPLPSTTPLVFYLSTLSSNLSVLEGQFLLSPITPPTSDVSARAFQCAVHTLAWTLSAPFPAPFPALLATAIFQSTVMKSCPTGWFPLPSNPSATTLLDFELDLDLTTPTGKVWSEWTSKVVPPNLLPSAVTDANLVIPTADTARLTAQLQCFLSSGTPVLLCGPPGSGKTMLLNSALGAGGNGRTPVWLSFSSSSTPEYLLCALEGHCKYVCERGGSGEVWYLEPRVDGEKMVLFCDEINLPSPDLYGCQRVISLLRQLLETGGFWAPLKFLTSPSSAQTASKSSSSTTSTLPASSNSNVSTGPPSSKTPVFIRLRGIQILGACNPPGDAGRQALPPRFLAHTPVIYVGVSSPPILTSIYGTLFTAMIPLLPNLLGLLTPHLTSASLAAWSAISARFSPAGSSGLSPQCVYSPRDLSRWVRALYEAFCQGEALFTDAGGGVGVSTSLTRNAGVVVSLWAHEGERLFCDRLERETDVEWVKNTLLEVGRRYLEGTSRGLAHPGTLPSCTLFTDWGRNSLYATNLPSASTWLQQNISQPFSAAVSPLLLPPHSPLLITHHMATNALRLTRVLGQPLGHALLLGASGVGKTLLAHLSAFIKRMPVCHVCPQASPNYSVEEFDRELRGAMLRAGADRESLVLLFDLTPPPSSPPSSSTAPSSMKAKGKPALSSSSTSPLNHATAFLERMNALLAGGEVPGLWEGEERELLFNRLREKKGGSSSASSASSVAESALFKEFTRGVQRHLHVVFCVTPQDVCAFQGGARGTILGDSSPPPPNTSRAAASHALFNRCVTLWLGDWDFQTRAEFVTQFVRQPLELDSWTGVEEWNEGGGVTEEGSNESNPLSIVSSALENWKQAPDGSRSASPASALMSVRAAWNELKVERGPTPVLRPYAEAVCAGLVLVHDCAVNLTTPQSAPFNIPPGTPSLLTSGATPRHFLDLCCIFSSLYNGERRAFILRLCRTSKGLQKLTAAGVTIASLRTELGEKRRALQTAGDAAAAKLTALMKEQGEAEKQRAAALSLGQELEVKASAVNTRNREVEKALAQAEPILVSAREAVQGIARAHLDELRSLTTPPAPVKLCLELVLIMIGALPPDPPSSSSLSNDWPEIRRVIKGGDFIPTVVSLASERLTAGVRRCVTERLRARPECSFERVQGASKAAGPLHAWVTSHLAYADCLERVAPLRSEAAALVGEQGVLKAGLERVAGKVAVLQASADRLGREYEGAVSELEALKSAAQGVEARLGAAGALLDSLSSEKSRWEASLLQAPTDALKLAPHAILGAAYTVYCGRWGAGVRNALEEAWRAILFSQQQQQGVASLSLPYHLGDTALSILAPPALRLSWASGSGKLDVADEVTLGNAAILTWARRTPLLCDASPSKQASLQFLKQGVYGSNSGGGGKIGDGGRPSLGYRSQSLTAALATVPILDSYSRPLEAAVRFGTPILLTHCEALGVHGGGGSRKSGAHFSSSANTATLLPILDACASLGFCGIHSVVYPEIEGKGELLVTSLHRPTSSSHGTVKIGDAVLDFLLPSSSDAVSSPLSSNPFRLFLHAGEEAATLLSSLSSHLISRLSVVAYGVEESSLSSVLLDATLAALSPSVAKQRASLLASGALSQGRLVALEDKLLSALSSTSATSNILNDPTLLQTLEATKVEAKETEKEAAHASAVLTTVASLRLGFTPPTDAASAMHSAITQLGPKTGCPLYTWGLETVLQGYYSGLSAHMRAIEEESTSNGEPGDNNAVLALTSRVLGGITTLVCRGTYERHSHAFLLRAIMALAKTAHTLVEGASSDKSFPLEFSALSDAVGIAEVWSFSSASSPVTPLVSVPTSLPNSLARVLPPSATLALSRLSGLVSPAPSTLVPWQVALQRSLTSNTQQWVAWCSSSSPTSNSFPLDWESVEDKGGASEVLLTPHHVLSYFRRLVVASLTRPDTLTSLITSTALLLFPPIQMYSKVSSSAVIRSGGRADPLTGPLYSLLAALGGEGGGSCSSSDVSTPAVAPILVFCTPGADADALVKAAREGFGPALPSLLSFSLGSSEVRSDCESAVLRGFKEGGWVFVRNIHLEDGEWLCGLLALANGVGGGGGGGSKSAITLSAASSKHSDTFSYASQSVTSSAIIMQPHPGFRLIFTAQVPFLPPPSASLSISGGKSQPPLNYPLLPTQLLTSCRKILLETPAGLKATFLRSLARVRGVGGMGVERRSDLGARLAWSHALILERRRYVPTGWSQAYDFCDADLDSAVATLNLFEESGQGGQGKEGSPTTSPPSFLRAPLRKLLGEALYGGRIENSGDDGTLAKVLAISLGSGEMLSLESMLLREGGGGVLLKQGFLGQSSVASGSYEPIRAPAFSPSASPSLEAWEKWAAELPSTLSPSVLGLSPATDLQLSVRGAADVLRVAHAL